MYYQGINIDTAIVPDAHIPHQKYAFMVKVGKIVDRPSCLLFTWAHCRAVLSHTFALVSAPCSTRYFTWAKCRCWVRKCCVAIFIADMYIDSVVAWLYKLANHALSSLVAASNHFCWGLSSFGKHLFTSCSACWETNAEALLLWAI